MRMLSTTGFSLAELLLALLILGQIAVFTIPKVLTAQQKSDNIAKAKEAAGMVSEALQVLKAKQGITATTRSGDLIQYMNYVKRDTTSIFDGSPGDGADFACSNFSTTGYCLQLHSGALLNLYDNNVNAGHLGDSDDDYEFACVDPDGKDGPSYDSICFLFNPKGRIKAWGQLGAAETRRDGNEIGPCSSPPCDPSWFKW